MKFSCDFPGISWEFPGIPGNFLFPKVGNGIFYLFAFPFPKMGMEFAIHIHIPVPENGNGICHFPFPFPKSKSHSRSWLLSPRNLHAWHLEASNCQAVLHQGIPHDDWSCPLLVLGIFPFHFHFLKVCVLICSTKHFGIPTSSILNHAFWYWVLAWVICCFMMTDHIPSYESIPPSSILNHALWYWVLAWVICYFMMTDHVL